MSQTFVACTLITDAGEAGTERDIGELKLAQTL
jgi:hypothetical protein